VPSPFEADCWTQMATSLVCSLLPDQTHYLIDQMHPYLESDRNSEISRMSFPRPDASGHADRTRSASGRSLRAMPRSLIRLAHSVIGASGRALTPALDCSQLRLGFLTGLCEPASGRYAAKVRSHAVTPFLLLFDSNFFSFVNVPTSPSVNHHVQVC
jgi:hypothetical protein